MHLVKNKIKKIPEKMYDRLTFPTQDFQCWLWNVTWTFLEKNSGAVFGQVHALPSNPNYWGLTLHQIRPQILTGTALKVTWSSLHTVTYQNPRDPKAPEEPLNILSSARETGCGRLRLLNQNITVSLHSQFQPNSSVTSTNTWHIKQQLSNALTEINDASTALQLRSHYFGRTDRKWCIPALLSQ